VFLESSANEDGGEVLEIGHQLARSAIKAFSVLFAACDRDVWEEVTDPWQVTIVTQDFDEPIDATSTVRLLVLLVRHSPSRRQWQQNTDDPACGYHQHPIQSTSWRLPRQVLPNRYDEVDAISNWEWIDSLRLDQESLFRNERLENRLMRPVTGEESFIGK
jgi:hypothetical protein